LQSPGKAGDPDAIPAHAATGIPSISDAAAAAVTVTVVSGCLVMIAEHVPTRGGGFSPGGHPRQVAWRSYCDTLHSFEIMAPPSGQAPTLCNRGD